MLLITPLSFLHTYATEHSHMLTCDPKFLGPVLHIAYSILLNIVLHFFNVFTGRRSNFSRSAPPLWSAKSSLDPIQPEEVYCAQLIVSLSTDQDSLGREVQLYLQCYNITLSLDRVVWCITTLDYITTFLLIWYDTKVCQTDCQPFNWPG